MADANLRDHEVVTPECTFLFPNLFEPRPVVINGKQRGDPVYSLSLLLDPDDARELKLQAAAVAKAKWGNSVDLKALRMPFTDGAAARAKAEKKGKDGDFYEGKVVLKTKSQFAPGVVGPDKKEIIDPKKVYSGCLGYACVAFVAYDGVDGGDDGVTCYLQFAMKSRDGDRIAGRDASSVFAGIEGGQSDEDPTEGLDDEIPF